MLFVVWFTAGTVVHEYTVEYIYSGTYTLKASKQWNDSEVMIIYLAK